MKRHEPRPPKYEAALLVFGEDVPRDVLEEMSVHLELLLEEVGRAITPDEPSEVIWQTVDSALHDQRVLVMPEDLTDDVSGRVALGALEKVRRGISYLTGRAASPSGFSDEAVAHLERISSALDRSDVSRLVFYANRQSVPLTASTLANLRWLTAAEAG